jgi:ATP-dependent Zn protease
MNRPSSALMSLTLALAVALAPLAAVASAAEEGAIVYTHESEAQFQQQLAAKKVKSVIVNKRLRTLRVTLTDGTHVLAHYPKHQEPQTVEKLKASGATVSVLSKARAEQEAKAKPVHHKLRYIAGGVVIALIVIVGIVLLIRRRRQRY